MEEITKYETQELVKLEEDLNVFLKRMNRKPSASALKKHPMVNAMYLPIEVLEMALDSIYKGHWNIENLNVQVLVNSVVVSLDLKVLHPITKAWIIRGGVGSVPVEISKKTGNPNPMALQKNVPAAKAYAFKNACSSLGKRFGRDVNRKVDIPYFEDQNTFENILPNG